MKHVIRGIEFEIKYLPFLGYEEGHKKDGDCDHPSVEEPKIRLRKGLKGLEKFETLLHEAMHGGFPDLKEEAITEFAHDASRMIWKEMEFRK